MDAPVHQAAFATKISVLLNATVHCVWPCPPKALQASTTTSECPDLQGESTDDCVLAIQSDLCGPRAEAKFSPHVSLWPGTTIPRTECQPLSEEAAPQFPQVQFANNRSRRDQGSWMRAAVVSTSSLHQSLTCQHLRGSTTPRVARCGLNPENFAWRWTGISQPLRGRLH